MAKAFFGGLPTGPDVEKLNKRFGVPGEGDVIEHAEIEDVLGIVRESSRYRTVLNAWRRQMYRKHNVFLAPRGDGEAFVAAPPNMRIDLASGKVASGRRAISRGLMLAHTTDHERLDDEHREASGRLALYREAVLDSAKSIASRKLPVPA